MNDPTIKQSRCPFVNLFGKPNEGVHKYRIGGFAAVDLAVTIAAAYFIAAKRKKSFGKTLAKLVVLGVFLHRIFGVNTALNNKIFRDKIIDQ